MPSHSFPTPGLKSLKMPGCLFSPAVDYGRGFVSGMRTDLYRLPNFDHVVKNNPGDLHRTLRANLLLVILGVQENG